MDNFVFLNVSTVRTFLIFLTVCGQLPLVSWLLGLKGGME